MKSAQSSHIQGHDYAAESRTLDIQFTNGAVYRYNGVDPNTYYAFSQSSSPGSYFHSKIKNRFPSNLIAPGPRAARSKR